MAAVAHSSEQLAAIIDQLSPFCGAVEVTMSGEDFDQIVRQLSIVRKSTVHLEREVGAFRLAEAARSGQVMVEKLARDQFEGLVRDPDGKVIRPDFGGRS